MGKAYFIKTPWWLKKLYPKRTWNKERDAKSIYLTFDDGPEPLVTPFVLDQLKKYNAKATFFCIGENVEGYPDLYQRILGEGHRTGNHTHTHPNGWKTPDDIYLSDIAEAMKYIDSDLFRPPYGRMKFSQARRSRNLGSASMKIIMWEVLSGDFDENTSPEQCLENVKSATKDGSIVVFHDSVKAMEKVKRALPEVLAYFSEKGYTFKAL